MATDGYEWDAVKATSNLRKHGEERHVSIGTDSLRRVLVTLFTQRGDAIRIISSRRATTRERRTYQDG